MNILDQLAAHARGRVEAAQKMLPKEEIRRRAFALCAANAAQYSPGALPAESSAQTSGSAFPAAENAAQYSPRALPAENAAQPSGSVFPFEAALRRPGLSFICECKKASPSKGLIAPDYPYLDIAKAYEDAGADCISVLTEPKWFLGKDEYLKQIASSVSIPCLRKDFTVDDYMIYEAKILGASAVLLICSILSPAQIRDYLQLCGQLQLSALVEAHDEAEIDTALEAGARIIGVNNRNLKDFSVDTENSRRLRARIPRDVLFVSESGVRNADDTTRLREIGADAVLIGEALMRAPDKRAMLRQLRGEQRQ